MGNIGVLVVDDSMFMRKVITDLLSSDPGIEVVGTARDGRDALEAVRKLRPDVITLDIEMPKMDGITALKELMKTDPTPVIMVSALTQEGAEMTFDALELGAVDYVTKPYAASLVRSRVRTHVSLYHHCTRLQEMVALSTAELLDTRLEIIRRLGRAAEYRDNETGMHVMRMSHITRLLALAHSMNKAKAEKLISDARMVVAEQTVVFETAEQVAGYYENVVQRITTGSRALDKILGGGIETSSSYSFGGPHSTGKTQIVEQIAVNCKHGI